MNPLKYCSWYTPLILTIAILTALYQYPANKKFTVEELPKIDLRTGDPIANLKDYNHGPAVQAIIQREAQNTSSRYQNYPGTNEPYYTHIRAELKATGAVTDQQITDLIEGEAFYPAQIDTTIAQRENYINSPEMRTYCTNWWLKPILITTILLIFIKLRR